MTTRSRKQGRPVRPLLKDEDEYRKAVNRRVVEPFMKTLRSRIARASTYEEAIDIVNSARLTQAVERAANQMPSARLSKAATDQRKRFIRSVSSLGRRFNPASGDLAAANFLQSAISQNSDYVSGITRDMREQLIDEIQDLQRSGKQFSKANVRSGLQKARRTGRAKSKLITRDQYSKFYGGLAQIRQSAAGIFDYIWQTKGDDRVRDTHSANDNREFAWSNPPSRTGHPGEDVNCRCLAAPLIPS